MEITTGEFYFLEMKCCKHQLCWLGSRMPTFCPKCGEFLLTEIPGINILLKSSISMLSKDAQDAHKD